MRICIDAGPLENGHRDRGIGWCTFHLLRALTPELVLEYGADMLYLKRTPADATVADHTGAQFAPRSGLAKWTSTGGRMPAHWTERWKPLETRLLFPRDVRATNADVLVCTDPQAIAIAPGFRTVAVLYDLVPLRFANQYLPRTALISRASYEFQLRQIRRAHHLIAISEASRRDAIELLGIPPNRISVAYLAVDRERFKPSDSAYAREQMARSYSIERPYFLYVGGFDDRKNLRRLVHAFSRVAASNDTVLAIAGTLGRLGEQLRTEMAELPSADRIRWLGYVPEDDLPMLYTGALALAFPSIYEGFGLPVLEAMSCGTPVLTSPTSSLPEVAEDAALYANPYSIDEIAAGLRRLATEQALRAELRERGLERAERFSWTDTARHLLHVCSDLSRAT